MSLAGLLLEYCQAQRAAILSLPYTRELSRRLEAIDALEESIWDEVQRGE